MGVSNGPISLFISVACTRSLELQLYLIIPTNKYKINEIIIFQKEQKKNERKRERKRAGIICSISNDRPWVCSMYTGHRLRKIGIHVLIFYNAISSDALKLLGSRL